MRLLNFTPFMLLFFFCEISAKKVKRKELYPNQHHQLSPSQQPPPYRFEPRPEGRKVLRSSGEYHFGSKGTFSASSGLRVIAQGSADQANSAVASQNAAAKQAAYLAKNTLANSATQAAATALAALKGKEVLLQRLEEQHIEATQQLENELNQLTQAKRSAKSAQHAAQQAINHVAVLTAALNNAQSTSEQTQSAASEAAAELASQTSMVGTAKSKLEHLQEQLHNARIDFEATREAAEHAAHSAQEAQNNANEAAIHATDGLHEAVVNNPTGGGSAHEDIALNHNYGEVSNDHKYNLAGY